MLLIFFLSPQFVQAKNYAFLVAVADYDNPEIADLNTPVNDINAIAEILKNKFDFKISKILLSSKGMARYKGAEYGAASLSDIEYEWEEEFLSQLEDGDVILFYFAGHGIDLRGRTFLLPSDAGMSVKCQAGGMIEVAKQALKLATAELAQPKTREVAGKLRNVPALIDACIEDLLQQAKKQGGKIAKLSIKLAKRFELGQGVGDVDQPKLKELAMELQSKLRTFAKNRKKIQRPLGKLLKTYLDFQALIERLSERQEDKDIVGIFFLDACRENPYAAQPDLDAKFEVGPGIYAPPPNNLFFLYSAGLGQTAIDQAKNDKKLDQSGVNNSGVAIAEGGSGKTKPPSHSIFAKALIEVMNKNPTEPIEVIARRVRSLVVKRAQEQHNHIQIPAIYSQLTRSIMLNGVASVPRNYDLTNESFAIDLSKLQHRDSFIECSFCPEMVVIKRKFPEQGVSKPFAIGRYEVTKEQWQRCVDDGDCEADQELSKPRDAKLPASGMSWQNVKKFIKWMNSKVTKSKGKYRLPSEAEWLFAARGGADVKQPYFFGKSAYINEHENICRYANLADKEVGVVKYAFAGCSDGIGRETAQVGSYRANGFGLYDMHGNVWEWTSNCWRDDKDVAGINQKECEYRSARGGSWRSGKEALRLNRKANRFPADHSRDTIGLRVVRDLQ